MSGRPRIIHLADYANRHPGSFAPMLFSAFEAARERGWRTEAVLDDRTAHADWVSELRSAGATVHFAPAVDRIALSRYVRGLVALDGDAPAILHTHFTRFDIPAVIGAAGRPDVSVVWHEHTYLKRRPLILARNVLRLAAFGRGADLVLCAAPETAVAMRRRGAPAGRVEYFPNGIDPTRFSPASPAEKESARAEFGLPADARILLHFGWSWELKGGGLFLEALARLRDEFPDVFGVIAIGTEETVPAARRLGLQDHIAVVPPTDRIDRLMQASDGVMALSRMEGGTPFAVLEALSSGLAVVASDISGHRAIGGRLEACRIVPRETDAITQAAAGILGRSQAEVEMEGEAARRHIEAEFSLQHWTEKLMKRYEALPGSGDAVETRPRVARPGSQAPTVIQLCDFRRKEGGSFIPTITSTLVAAREAGWAAKAVFIEPPGPVDWEGDFRDLDLEVEFVPSNTRASLGHWLIREIAGYGPAILHSHFTTWDVPASVASLRKRSAVPIWHMHSTLPENAYTRLRNVVKFASLGRGVGAILCPSQNIIDGVLRRGGPPGRVLLWPSAIDTERLRLLSDADRLEARAELGLPKDVPVVLHFGWHWHLKGGDVFLEALRELVSSGLDDVIGLERGGQEAKFSEYAAGLGISEHLVQVPPVPEIGVLFGAADALLTSSRSEGMAYSVVESLASGTPVVATPIPGHTILGDNLDACRIATHEPKDLAREVLETLERDPEAAKSERDQARAWIEEHLSLDSNADRLVELYREALAGHPLSPPVIA